LTSLSSLTDGNTESDSPESSLFISYDPGKKEERKEGRKRRKERKGKERPGTHSTQTEREKLQDRSRSKQEKDTTAENIDKTKRKPKTKRYLGPSLERASAN
jgi:hypothetical protein